MTDPGPVEGDDLTAEEIDIGEPPAHLADVLREGLARDEDVPVRDAATVVIVRDGEPGLEVLVQRRAPRMEFAGGMTVFPGGAVDEGDYVPCPWQGPDAPRFSAPLRAASDGVHALLAAATRETFEEVGILLAAGVAATDLAERERSALRTRLEQGEVTLSEVLGSLGGRLAADRLHPWAVWVTPRGESRRYNTRFLIARLPSGEAVGAPASEAREVWWQTPQALLERVAARDLRMMPPTLKTLQDLTEVSSAEQAIALAVGREVLRYQPRFAVDKRSGRVRGTLRVERPSGH